jgi:hypothetical protein
MKMQIVIVTLLFLGIIMILLGVMMINSEDLLKQVEIINKNKNKINIYDDNVQDEILQQQFSTNAQDSLLESQFSGPNVSEIFGEQFDKGALFSHGFILGTELKPLHESNGIV